MFFITLISVSVTFFFYLLLQFLSFLYGTFIKKTSLESYKPRNGAAWALVTGASDGIGLAFVERLAVAGFNVIMHGRNPQKLQSCIDELKSQYPNTEFVAVIAEAKDVSLSNIQKIVDAVGVKDLCILVNNVGQAQNQKMMPLENLEPADIQDTVVINCLFNSLVTHALLPKLKNKTHKCAIINISSVVAFAYLPTFSVYAATKAYLHSFSTSLSAELVGQSVDVLCVSPGYVVSNMTKEKPSVLVSSADAIACHSLNRIGCVDIIPGLISGYTYCALAVTNLIPLPIRPRIMNIVSHFAYKPRGLKK